MHPTTKCITINPLEYFREQISEAQQVSGINFRENLEFYIVNLLTEYISNPVLDTPFAMVFKEALEADQEKQMRLFKILGDQSLYVAGFFQDSFNRKSFDMSYIIQMGSGAYASLAEIHYNRHTGNSDLPKLYESLAANFSSAVEVIAYIADRSGGENTTNLLAVYDRWTKAPSDRLLKKLLANGIDPILTNTKIAN